MTAPQAIHELIQKFEAEKANYESGEHKEAQVRQSLIDPLFEALGWDMTDPKQVRQEFSLEDEGHNVFPDYSFHIHDRTDPIFYMEAKGVYVDIENNEKTAQQVRRYSSTSKHDIAILTDFEELSIYNGLQVVDKSDKAHIARLDHLRYTDYIEKWEWIYALLSRDAVIGGSLEAYAGTKRPKGTQTVDEAFLNTLEDWRGILAEDIYAQNKALNLTDRELNIAVQRTIDRIVFLRITEARGIAYARHTLNRYLEGDVYGNLKTLFREANDRFNSGLFHFVEDRKSEEGDAISMKISISPQPLREIINSIYYPESPYEFSVMPADILGQVYERFLGSVITRVDDGIDVDLKPEVRKAGGVYYTPTYIVDYIVENTVGKLLEGKNPAQVAKLRILDPACGSGSFLLGAYQYLMDWHLDYYRDQIMMKPGKKRLKELLDAVRYETDNDGAIQVLGLNVHEKRRILLNNLYGVDLDQQAVEVTKLSLLLKMLENETEKTTASARPEQIPLIRGDDRLLPPLHDNIKWGNSLIGSDFYDDKKMTQMAMFEDEAVQEELYRVRAFDWEIQFEKIMVGGGFDAVIGNPPYIRIQNMKEFAPETIDYYKKLYEAAKRGNYDIYVVFVEKAIDLLNEKGCVGYILPHKFFNANYGKSIRGLISKGNNLSHIVHFGHEQVFDGATTYTCLLFLDKLQKETFSFVAAHDLAKWRISRESVSGMVSCERVNESEWNFVVGQGAELFYRFVDNSIKLGELADIFVGLQTSADKVFMMNFLSETESHIKLYSQSLDCEYEFEKSLIHPVVSGTNVNRYTPLSTESYILFPYIVEEEEATLIGWNLLKQNYPMTASYFEANRAILEDRERGKFRDKSWYRFGRSQNLGIQERIKICIPRLVESLYVAFDSTGSFFLDNVDVCGITPKVGYEHYHYHYWLALLNSSFLRWYFPFVSGTFRGGWLSANKQFLSQLPIRTIDFENPDDVALHDALVQHVQNMLDWHKQLGSAPAPLKTVLEGKIEKTDKAIDQLVYELYDLTAEEIAIVEGRETS